MTIKEAEKENRTRPKTRARRDNIDLRKKVLKDQTSRIINQSPLRDSGGNSPVLKSKIVTSKKDELKAKSDHNEKDNINRVSCEEKTLQIQRHLERIIHKKKPETKAMEMLVMLQQMKFTSSILESTKICYTLDALKLVVVDKKIVEKAEQTVEILQKVINKNEGAIQTKSENKTKLNVEEYKNKENEKLSKSKTTSKPSEDDTEATKEKKPEAKSYREWRDAKAEEKIKENLRLDKEKESKDIIYDKKKKEYEKKMREFKEKEARLERKAEKLERNREKFLSEEVEEKVTVEETNEQGSSEETSSMRIGFWMDKLLGQVDSLSLLDKKIGNMEKKVKDLPSTGLTQQDPAKSVKEKKKIGQKKSANIFDDELLKITQSVQKINITEDSIETVSVQVDNTKIKTVQKDHAFKDTILTKAPPVTDDVKHTLVAKYKTVLDNETKYEVSEVLETLKSLQSAQMSILTLTTTKVGMSVNNLRKSSANSEVKDVCKTLILSWKKLMPRDCSKIRPEKPDAEQESDKATTAVSPKDVREYCKKKLLTSLISDTKESDHKKAEAFAKELEEEIFKIYKEANSKYRNQVNSRFFNIRGNAVLQQRILEGSLKACEVASMTHDELADDKMKEARAKWTKEALRSSEEKHVTDDFCTCRICLPPWIKA